jgi:hypothetical protein
VTAVLPSSCWRCGAKVFGDRDVVRCRVLIFVKKKSQVSDIDLKSDA